MGTKFFGRILFLFYFPYQNVHPTFAEKQKILSVASNNSRG